MKKILFSELKRKSIQKRIKKILFFKIGAIGDIIMTTPLVRAVRKRYPNAEINYLCGKSFSSVLNGNKNIDRIIEFDEKIFFNHNLIKIINLARNMRKNRYDIVFVLDKHWAAGVFASLIGRRTIGFDRGGEGFANTISVKYNNEEHEIIQYLKLGKIVGAKGSTKTEIFISKKDEEFARNILKERKKIIAIAPGGGKNKGEKVPIRRWDVKKWIKLVSVLSKDHLIVILGNKDDIDIAKKIQKKVKSKKIINLAGICSIQQSAAIMKRCSAIVCTDSGAMHIASAVNKKIVSIFGPSNPKRKAPLSKKSIWIWKDSNIYEPDYDFRGKIKRRVYMKNIDVEDVICALRKMKAF